MERGKHILADEEIRDTSDSLQNPRRVIPGVENNCHQLPQLEGKRMKKRPSSELVGHLSSTKDHDCARIV